MPVAVTPPLTPIEEESEGSLPSPIQPLAWKCCQCNLQNYFFDYNYARFQHIPERCIHPACPHQCCAACQDPGPLHRPIQYAQGRPIPLLFAELHESLEGTEDDEYNAGDGKGEGDGDGDGDSCQAADGSSSDSSSSCATYRSSMELSSDEEYSRFLLNTTTTTVSIGGNRRGRRAASASASLAVANESFPCPLRESHFCLERFGSHDAAWTHSVEHVGQETVRCTRAGCAMTFSGKEAMRLHYIAVHS